MSRFKDLGRIGGYLAAAVNRSPRGRRDGGVTEEHRRFLAARLCLLILFFLLAVCVRVLAWQDASVEMARHESFMTSLVNSYRTEAERMTSEGLLIPNRAQEDGDARMLVHPPGYSLLLIFLKSITSYKAIIALQVVVDCVAVAVVFLIADELLGLAVAVVSAGLAAFSPHLACYSLWLTPDSLIALPTLLSVLFLVKGVKSGKLWQFIVSGTFIGLSCWLRSNGLLLAPFLSIIAFFLMRSNGRKVLSAAAITGAALLVILPLTVRNFIVFHRFIPTSIGNGITMIEGIADYDKANRFGMPSDDVQAAVIDAEWHNRPDYARNLWAPDGIDRDQYRFRRGLIVAALHPIWFASVMARRAAFMLSYNDSKPHYWPLNTAIVPVISGEAPFGHAPSYAQCTEPVASISPADFAGRGTLRSKGAQVELSPASDAVYIRGDQSPYGPQFASPAIAVKEKTDYMLNVAVSRQSGTPAVEVIDGDERIILASSIVPSIDTVRKSLRFRERHGGELTMAAVSIVKGSTDKEPIEQGRNGDVEILHIVFSSGSAGSVKLVVSNNGNQEGACVLKIVQTELCEFGPTPQWWTRYPRTIIREIQKRVYLTNRLTPVVIIGPFLLLAFGDRRALLLLAAIPAYYLISQSMFHTEYRYILPIHYFLFIFAGMTACAAGSVILGFSRRAIDKRRGRQSPEESGGVTASSGSTTSISD